MPTKVHACIELLASPVAIPSLKLPVSCANIASVVSWNATAVDYNSKKNEACAGEDLDYAEDEFDLFKLARASEDFWDLPRHSPSHQKTGYKPKQRAVGRSKQHC